MVDVMSPVEHPPRVRITQTGPVVTVALNRPHVRNALDERTIADLTRWAAGPLPASARVVVLRGEGPVFCAGADITWMAKTVDYSRDQNVADAQAMAQMFASIDALPVPLVGRVHGAALGGGAGLAAVCDIVVAADDAVFGFTEVKLGIIPAVISPFALAKIGISAARELFLTGARFPAARAREIGLVHTIVPEAGLDTAVDACIKEVLTCAPGAVSAAKALIRRVAWNPPADVAGLTADAMAARRVSSEGQEGMRAFLARRAPRWTRDA